MVECIYKKKQSGIWNSTSHSYYIYVNTELKLRQTNIIEINISEFLLTFAWLLSLKCHVCLSFVIKMRKMTKLRQKLQCSNSDIICLVHY